MLDHLAFRLVLEVDVLLFISSSQSMIRFYTGNKRTKMQDREVFEIWDYLVVGAMLLLSGAIGVYFRFSGGKQRTTNEYLMAGRNMGMLPVILSLMATIQTAVGTLGFPGEVYLYGAQLYLYPLGFTVALIICTFVHTPVYFGIQVTSAYEYLEKRFGKLTRTIISGLFVIQMILFMSVGLYSPSIALSAVSGLSHIVSILAVGIVCAFYCTLGGMKAVLWTDVLQSILMFLALLSVIIKGSIDMGGFQEVLNIAEKGGRLNFFNTTFDPTLRFTVWSALIGGFMYGMTTCGANQTQVQRLLTVSTLRRSQLALCIAMTYIVGNIKAIIPAAFVVFTAIGGPTLSIITLGMLTTTSNQKGIIVGLLSGIALNAWIGTGAIISDFPQIKLPQSTEFCPANSSESLFFPTMSYLNSTNVTLTTIVTEATIEPTDGISILKEEIFPLFKLSFLLHPVPGTILTFLLGYIVSFITGGDTNVDENLICPFMRKCLSANTLKTEDKVQIAVAALPDGAHYMDNHNGFVNTLENGHFKNGKLKEHILEESKL
ncbi:sodium-coupled monocarboxylate transporter 1 [Trichonephila inaurata madagascariensis]|uniref:Sodium-coupled monocarboxylate transporter 1 n=2 Tax=Trichonephila TaxID=2585208 RepID=A0A8X6XWW4_9ARAC|nr:sodium-coupled monocarboxylate transporter 1 [Trichonephila inaurata madagascariensis]